MGLSGCNLRASDGVHLRLLVGRAGDNADPAARPPRPPGGLIRDQASKPPSDCHAYAVVVPRRRWRRDMTAWRSLRCKAILFDLDGVLVDSTECVERTWR